MKFSETKVGIWLKAKAPHILEMVGDAIPPPFKIGYDIVKGLIGKDAAIAPEMKAEFNALEAQHLEEMTKLENEANKVAQGEVTERLKIDMASDSWLSKNIRPMTMVYLLLLFTILCVVDSSTNAFQVDEGYKEIIKYLLMAVFSFYFIGREVNKWNTINQKGKEE